MGSSALFHELNLRTYWQARPTGSGSPMWGLQHRSISGSKGTKCCWSRLRGSTRCRTLTTPLMSTWGSRALCLLQLTSLCRITMLLSRHDSPPKCSQQPQSYATVALLEAFQVPHQAAQQYRLIGHSSRHDHLGILLMDD